MLSPQEAFHFDLKGYVLRKGAISADRVSVLNERLAACERTPRAELPRCAVARRTPALNELRIYNIIECAPEFLDLIDDEAWFDVVEQVVPQPCRLTEAYSITRARGLGNPLHRPSIAEYDRLSTKHLKAVVALSDCGPDDGPFVVIEGSHRSQVPLPYAAVHPDWDLPEWDRSYAKQFLERVGQDARLQIPWEQIPGYREIYVEAGDVLLFTEDIWHGAKAVRSDRVRRSLYFAYSPYHFANWHGLTYSEDLRSRATERQRRLIAGPFIGNRFAATDDPEVDPVAFPFEPESELKGIEDSPRGETDLHERLRHALEVELPRRLEDSDLEEHGATCRFDLAGDGGGSWLLSVESREVRAVHSDGLEPTSVVLAEAADFLRMFRGKADPVQMFYAGRLVVRGDVSLVMRIADLWGDPERH